MSKKFICIAIGSGFLCFCSVSSMNSVNNDAANIGSTYQISDTKTYIFHCEIKKSANITNNDNDDKSCPEEYWDRQKVKYCGLMTKAGTLSIGAVTVKSSSEENSGEINWTKSFEWNDKSGFMHNVERDRRESSCSNEGKVCGPAPSSEKEVWYGERKRSVDNGKTRVEYFLKVGKELYDVVWSAEVGFRKKEGYYSDKHEVFFTAWDKGYDSLYPHPFETYEELRVKYGKNGQEDHYEKRSGDVEGQGPIHLKDKPCYLHSYGKDGKPKELFDPNRNSEICTACDILERSLRGWEHNGALSVSGFLEKLGQCGEKKSYGWFSSKKEYQMMPQKADNFCRDFLVRSGLITDKDEDPVLLQSMYKGG